MKKYSIVGVLLLGACTDAKTSALNLMPEASETYAQIVLSSYEDSLSTAQSMDSALSALISGPSDSTMTAARNSWLDSREPYLQTEVYRFYEGPIDNEEGPEGLLNAWPMDESYVDYTRGQMGLNMTGIVNDTSVTIDGSTLESLNEQGGEENIATGYHAIEFLLWGQDFSDEDPGNRSYTDYVDRGDAGTFGCYNMTTHVVDCVAMAEAECADGDVWAPDACPGNADRRGLYLTEASTLLTGHLSSLVDDWTADSENYRSTFAAMSSDEQLTKILTGMIVLSGFETGGERLQTALDTGDQEDEHSCFSDNTHRDMVQDVQGIQNVYLGTYGSVSGTSIKDVVATFDAEIADRLEIEIQASLDAANALQVPFDNEIAAGNTDGNERVQALITALRTQEKTMEEVFRGFGFAVPAPE
ncbi:MAG: iron-regulated protein [Deltaproteobacteria bacterium]|nr:iron-regulated protein [Deltaproteobacteria bacterium]